MVCVLCFKVQKQFTKLSDDVLAQVSLRRAQRWSTLYIANITQAEKEILMPASTISYYGIATGYNWL